MLDVFVALGSNQGDRLFYLESALDIFRASGVLNAVSPLYSSEAKYVAAAPDYLNCCAHLIYRSVVDGRKMDSFLGCLMAECLEVEINFGRSVERVKFADRTLDIDIILVLEDGKPVNMKSTFLSRSVAHEVIVPHPLAKERLFVLLPLFDLMSNATLDGCKVSTLIADLRGIDDEPVRVMPCGTSRLIPVTQGFKWVLVVNVTPDSFAGSGAPINFVDQQGNIAVDLCVEHILKLVSWKHWDIVELGAESTRPMAVETSPNEQIRRLKPILTALKNYNTIPPLAIDTRSSQVIEEFLDLYPNIIVNDVSGLMMDPEMKDLLITKHLTLFTCHSLGTPEIRKQLELERYGGSVDTFKSLFPADLRETYDRAARRDTSGVGLYPWRIVLDPGVGMGKSGDLNTALFEPDIWWLSKIPDHVPIEIGVSRKRFVHAATKEAGRVPARHMTQGMLFTQETKKTPSCFLNKSEAKRAEDLLTMKFEDIQSGDLDTLTRAFLNQVGFPRLLTKIPTLCWIRLHQPLGPVQPAVVSDAISSTPPRLEGKEGRRRRRVNVTPETAADAISVRSEDVNTSLSDHSG